MQFLVSFMDKAIQDNQTFLVFLEKDSKVSRFHLPLLKSVFKIFILKFVKNAFFTPPLSKKDF